MDHKLVLIYILFLRLEYIYCANITQVETLYDNLFQKYNRKLFPLINHNDTVNVSFTVGIVSINNFDELSGEIELTMLFYMRWVDERLTWTPSDFDGKSTLLVPPEDVWCPQLYLLQSFDRIQDISNVSIMVRLSSSGLVIWNSGSVLKVVCSVDVTYFPFDTQTCEITVSGWAYTADEVMYYTTSSTVFQDYLSSNSQWMLESATVINYTDIRRTFPPSINIALNLKRRSDFFVVYIIFPMVFLGSINNLVFVMPASSGERTSVAITTFLSFIVFMQMINDTVPESSDPMAYIYYYILFLLVYSSAILFLCIVSLRIHDKEDPVPSVVIKLVFLLRFLCFKRKRKSSVMPERKFSNVSIQAEVKNNNFNENMENYKEDDSPTVTWKIVGKTFDKYCFTALFIAFLVMTTQTFTKLYTNQGF
ncbi:neuronal acetylcholine receptor subunit alpha-6-like [Mercenaria mercenaria]|uniref:neuronal acetylcholine receptor subunit alpha-6-like n=1 Tax=Mercenaria mercenaria TaxID=6596 RepID=UPI00234F02C6|nr:neuronal acetylcholine receptor subunit alpha-6-like [Mercenaria mercenaria]